MAKKRSKQDKVRQQRRQLTPKTTVVQSVEPVKTVKPTNRPASNLADFFDYDPQFVLKDLRKTLLISALILLVLLLSALVYTQ